jgi:hypothetical protein
MSWTRRGFQTVTTCAVVVVWALVFVVTLATAEPLPGPGMVVDAAASLAILALLWILAARIVLRHWWSGTGSRMSAMDPPARLLATAVAALPERRREWGMAMTAELAEVPGRSARWRFALSGARATLWLPPAGGWPALALVAGAAMASVAAAGQAVGKAVPGLAVFAVAFTGLVGAMVLRAVVRPRRLWLPVPAPTVLVAGGVAASIAATVIFLRREPAAVEHLPPAGAVFLAAVLASCLWVAVTTPRWLGTNRRAAHLGAAAAVALAICFLLVTRLDTANLADPLKGLLTLPLALAAVAIFLLPGLVATVADRSFRSGVQAAVWTVSATMPLIYALWLPEGLRRHAIDGALLDGALGPVAANLADARWALVAMLVIGLPLAVIGAGLAAATTRPPAAPKPPPNNPRPHA